jgi:hypothetical protein
LVGHEELHFRIRETRPESVPVLSSTEVAVPQAIARVGAETRERVSIKYNILLDKQLRLTL